MQFVDTPLHIVSESYGGKMAAGFVRAIIDAQAREDLKVNFRYFQPLHGCLACNHSIQSLILRFTYKTCLYMCICICRLPMMKVPSNQLLFLLHLRVIDLWAVYKSPIFISYTSYVSANQ